MDLGFIILRYVNHENANQYWNHCYECIRKFYPENPIYIIDSNKDQQYVKNKHNLHNTTIIHSEYDGRGELLPYYYYLNNKFCDTCVILHDSVFIQQYINFKVNKFKFIWSFDNIYDNHDGELKYLSIFNNEELISFYKDYYLWKGCFGSMVVITHDYLSWVNDKYNFTKLLDIILNKHDRMSFERVIAVMLQANYIEDNDIVLIGDIHSCIKFGTTYHEYLEGNLNLPIVKIWGDRQ